MAKRRGNSEGTITQRADGRWEARVSLPDGKRKCYYGKTRQEVQQKLKQAQRDIDAGLSLGDARQTTEQYLLSWLESIKHQLKPNTYRRYVSQIRLHAIPSIGRISLISVTPQHLQAIYSKKMAEGLASGTVRHLHVILHSAFAEAVRLSLLPRNIVDAVRPPRKVRSEMRVLDERQAAIFIEQAQRDYLGPLYIVAVTTGLRIGELTALRWRDVDLERGTVQVEQSLSSVGGKMMFTEPKTHSSRRTVRLTKVALSALGKQRVAHIEKALAFGPSWNTDDLVFPNEAGKPMDPHDLAVRKFRRFLAQAGLPRIRFHDLRHTAATLMLKRGVHVKVVSEMLGHSNISITLGIYGHVLPDMQQTAVDAMDDIAGS